MTTTTLRLQQRKGTASQWYGANTVLGDGEFGYDITNNILKIGNSSTSWNSLPSFLTTTGGTLTGALTLSGAPSANLHAATKLYVDTKIADLIGSAPGTLDTLQEIASILGTPEDITGSLISNINSKLPLSGGTMTGLITLSGAPTSNLHAATKLYVDSKTIDSLSGVSISSKASNDILQWNGSSWVNKTISNAGLQPAGNYILSSAIGTTVQAYDADLTAIAGISATSGLLKKTASDTWSLDTNTYLVKPQSASISTTTTLTITANTAISPFPTLALAANTAYELDMLVILNTGSTSHTVSISFTGPASFTMLYDAQGYNVATATTAATASTNASSFYYASSISPASLLQIIPGSTTTSKTIRVKGVVRVSSTSGNFSPNITFSVSPGGTNQIVANSYVQLTPIN